jgi:hypothetical protein
LLKPPAMQHQSAATAAALEHFRIVGAYFAWLMEQGTGKTRTIIDTAEALFLAQIIEALLVVAPNGVHRNWIDNELPKHCGIPYRAATWQSNMKAVERRAVESVLDPSFSGLRIIAMNMEAFSLKQGKAILFARRFLNAYRVLFPLDESSGIKNPCNRTRNLVALALFAHVRGIATGTHITESPIDAYYQFQFLSPGVLGFTTLTTFKAHYAEWRQTYVGHKNKDGTPKPFNELVRYRNLDQLKRAIDKHSFQIRKAECLDLPPKVYVKRPVEMTAEQAALYLSVKTQIITWLRENAETITITHALTRLVRLAQIAGGFYTADEASSEERGAPIAGKNPKIESMCELIEETPGKIIIFARFLPELRALRDRFIKEGYGGVASYWGEISTDERARGYASFQKDPTSECRFFLSNKTGAKGLDLSVANQQFYYSNEWSGELRSQSSDRPHRIGQTNKCTYTDFLAVDTIDYPTLYSLRNKKELADAFNGGVEQIIAWMNGQNVERADEVA